MIYGTIFFSFAQFVIGSSSSQNLYFFLLPLIVRPGAESAGSYEIIAGERRWRAAQLAQLDEVPAIVRDITDSESLEIALVENLQRENLSPLEEAEGYRRLIDEYQHTQDALGQILGKSRSHGQYAPLAGIA